MAEQMASPVAAAKKQLRSLIKQRTSGLSQEAVQAQSTLRHLRGVVC